MPWSQLRAAAADHLQAPERGVQSDFGKNPSRVFQGERNRDHMRLMPCCIVCTHPCTQTRTRSNKVINTSWSPAETRDERAQRVGQLVPVPAGLPHHAQDDLPCRASDPHACRRGRDHTGVCVCDHEGFALLVLLSARILPSLSWYIRLSSSRVGRWPMCARSLPGSHVLNAGPRQRRH